MPKSSANNSGNGLDMFIIGIIIVLVLFILGFVLYKYISGNEKEGSSTTIFKIFDSSKGSSKNKSSN